MSSPRRHGKNWKAYRRKAAQLRTRTARHNLPCTWCGYPIDTTLPYTHPDSFTADHTHALANGGHPLGDLEPMHRRCNASKGATQPLNIRTAT